MYTMDHPDFIRFSFLENSIGLKRVNVLVFFSRYMSDIPGLMKKCFPGGSPPGKGLDFLFMYLSWMKVFRIIPEFRLTFRGR